MKMSVKKRKSTLVGMAIIVVVGFAGFAMKVNYFEISKQMDIFTTLFKEINTYYVDDVEPGTLMKTGIDAMLNSLDPYTTYIPESDIEDFRFQTTGQYGGIGALIRKKNDTIYISEPYKGFAADKAGLVAGDAILEVDGKPVIGRNTSDVSKVLKGEAGSTVVLKIRKAGSNEIVTVSLNREEIQVDCVPYYGMVGNGIGYIRLNSFTDKAYNDVKNAYLDLEANNELKGIIIDLRGNPGGLLRESVNIVNMFTEKGTEVVSTRGKVKEWDKQYNGLNAPLSTEIPVTILVNSNSASASEIVSGALQDLDRAVIVGKKTFGKGLVQQPRNLSYNAQLKVTIAKYYTPSGRCIQAINYSEKDENGNVKAMPDSLRTVFKTKAGRSVRDGGGVEPDVTVETEAWPEILIALEREGYIFDFANLYAYKTESIAEPTTFSLTLEEYEEFVQFVASRDFDFQTSTEKKLDAFKKTAGEDDYLESLSQELEQMESKLAMAKDDDIHKHQTRIKEWLEQEIVTRYYYQRGRIEYELKNDPYLNAAIEVLNDQSRYREILSLAAKP
jgi:carboxyl-terminal processing protease